MHNLAWDVTVFGADNFDGHSYTRFHADRAPVSLRQIRTTSRLYLVRTNSTSAAACSDGHASGSAFDRKGRIHQDRVKGACRRRAQEIKLNDLDAADLAQRRRAFGLHLDGSDRLDARNLTRFQRRRHRQGRFDGVAPSFVVGLQRCV